MTPLPSEEGKRLIEDDRHKQYGDWSKNAKMARDAYRVFLGHDEVTNAWQEAFRLVLLKLAREMYKHKRDNIIDACGYLNLMSFEREHENETTDVKRIAG